MLKNCIQINWNFLRNKNCLNFHRCYVLHVLYKIDYPSVLLMDSWYAGHHQTFNSISYCLSHVKLTELLEWPNTRKSSLFCRVSRKKVHNMANLEGMISLSFISPFQLKSMWYMYIMCREVNKLPYGVADTFIILT